MALIGQFLLSAFLHSVEAESNSVTSVTQYDTVVPLWLLVVMDTEQSVEMLASPETRCGVLLCHSAEWLNGCLGIPISPLEER